MNIILNPSGSRLAGALLALALFLLGNPFSAGVSVQEVGELTFDRSG